ncbi:hypothetical protein M9Y10_024009 [Tritrichomonas musculus]|uniref:Uncharacterized protein n=1 Tax=Tritrichomonas musculus TaxID=1915356 RepID=A0ABR2KWN7_9EUKA
MNVTDLSVTYNNGYLNVNASFPSSFAISLMVVCFLSPLSSNNTDAELGNIETFLCNDSYYPQNSIWSRYSSIQDFNYVQNTTNCVRSSYKTQMNFRFDNDIGSPWVAFLNSSGVVRGPKSGVIANYTEKKYSFQFVNQLIQNVKADWDKRNISSGTIHAMLPDLLLHKTQCIDEEIVIEENHTIYENLGPDPRNPLDATRNRGIYPKCSSNNCFGNQFTSKFNGQVYRIHDNIFRAHLMIQLAESVMNHRC